MDKEYKRITEEQERRGLQRVIHYEQKNTTHKKLYSRVMSKSLLKDLGLTSVKVLTDLKVLDENKEPILRQKVIPWLSNQSNNNLISQCYISQALDRMLENPTETLLRKHGFFLNRERARLKKIEDDRIKAEEDFQEARKQRRERRRQLRLNRDKRGLETKCLNEIVNKMRSDVTDPLAIRFVDFDGGDHTDFCFVLPGGIILELYKMFSVFREKIAEKAEAKLEDFFKRDSLTKYLVLFLTHNNIHPDNFAQQLNEAAKDKLESAVALGEKNQFELNEKLDEIISDIVKTENLIPHVIWKETLKQTDFYSLEMYEDLMHAQLRIYLKSNDYKIPEEEEPPKVEDETGEKVEGDDLQNNAEAEAEAEQKKKRKKN